MTNPGSGHLVGRLIEDAVHGRWPDADGSWRRCSPWRPGLGAVVAVTGHAVIVVPEDVPESRLAALRLDGFGGATSPETILALGAGGEIETLDVLLARRGTAALAYPGGVGGLVPRPDLEGQPRAAHARSYRDDVQVWGWPEPAGGDPAPGDPGDLAIWGRGIGGLPELSVEAARPGRGGGPALVTAALRQVPAGQVVVAAVAPGNARSLRALLACGFVPIGSVTFFHTD